MLPGSGLGLISGALAQLVLAAAVGISEGPANLRAAVPTFVTEFQSRAIEARRLIPRYDQQIPQHIGSMTSTPVFCFQGCPQPLSVWSNEKVEVIAEQPPAKRRAAVGERNGAAGLAKNTPHLYRVSYGQAAPAHTYIDQIRLRSLDINDNLAVKVVKMHLASSSVMSNPVIEPWFGRNEMADWQPAEAQ